MQDLADAAQKVLGIQNGSIPRSAPSARASKPRRSCEESLAARAWASKPRHYRRIPKSPYAQLEALLSQLSSPRKVYRRLALKALDSGDVEAITEAMAAVGLEIARLQAAAAHLRAAYQQVA